MRQKKETKKTNESIVDLNKLSLFELDYLQIVTCMGTKNISPAKDTLGFDLIEYRTKKFSKHIESQDDYNEDLFFSGLMQLTNKLKNKWVCIFELAKERSSKCDKNGMKRKYNQVSTAEILLQLRGGK